MAGFWEAKVVSVVTTINGYRHTRGGRTRFADSYQMLWYVQYHVIRFNR